MKKVVRMFTEVQDVSFSKMDKMVLIEISDSSDKFTYKLFLNKQDAKEFAFSVNEYREIMKPSISTELLLEETNEKIIIFSELAEDITIAFKGPNEKDDSINLYLTKEEALTFSNEIVKIANGI